MAVSAGQRAWFSILILYLAAARLASAQSLDGTALNDLRSQAEMGNPEAQLTLGMLYYSGQGVPQHAGEAARWLRRAAENGLAEAQSNLGVLYLKGQGLPVNNAEAFRWINKAANQGLPAAQVNLARLYLDGIGVRKFPSESVRWFRRAANQGDRDGQRSLGTMLTDGQGAGRDLIEAYKWFNLAAAQGDERASDARTSLTRLLTPQQISEGQRRAIAFRPAPEASASKKLHKSGTGFFVDPAGYLVTCYHVIEGATRIQVTTKRGTIPAQVVKVDSTNDVALLKVSGTFPALAVSHSRTAKLGDPVVALGYPNVGVQGKELKLTRGEINSLAGIKDDSRYFQMSAPVQPGNSGGPLLDRSGNVIGLVTLRLNDWRLLWATGAVPQNVNYSLKSAYLLELLQNSPEVRKSLLRPATAMLEPFEIVNKADGAVVLIEAN